MTFQRHVLFSLSDILLQKVIKYIKDKGFSWTQFILSVRQCCQVAEIPAKKLKRGRRKKKLAERICGWILAEFYKKAAEKGLQKIFKRSSLFLAMITTYNWPNLSLAI